MKMNFEQANTENQANKLNSIENRELFLQFDLSAEERKSEVNQLPPLISSPSLPI